MRKNFGRIIKNFKKSKKIQLSHKNNARDTNYFTKNFTNCWYGKWLLVNEKVILTVGLNKNQWEIDHINIL